MAHRTGKGQQQQKVVRIYKDQTPEPINRLPPGVTALPLWTNAFQVDLPDTHDQALPFKVYRYKVDVQPTFPNKRIRQIMFSSLLSQLKIDQGVDVASNSSDQLLATAPIDCGDVVIPHPKKEKMAAKKAEEDSKLAEEQVMATEGQSSHATPSPKASPSPPQRTWAQAVQGKAQESRSMPLRDPPKASQPSSGSKSNKTSLRASTSNESSDRANVGMYDFTFTISAWDAASDQGLSVTELSQYLYDSSSPSKPSSPTNKRSPPTTQPASPKYKSSSPFNKHDHLSALNILLRHGPKSKDNVLSIGHERLFSKTSPAENLPAGLELRTGFFTSFRTVPGRLVLNVNTNRAAFYRSQSLDDLIVDWLAFQRKVSRSAVKLSDDLKDPKRLRELNAFLQGIVIRTTHLTPHIGEERTASLTGLPATDRQQTVSTWKFNHAPDGEKERMVTVKEYFTNIKQYGPLNANGLVVCAGSRGTVYPSEKCFVLPGTHAQKRLRGSLKDTAVSAGVKEPYLNLKAIVDDGLALLDVPKASNNAKANIFGIEVRPQLLSVNARLLGPPVVVFGNNKSVPDYQVNRGDWNLQDLKLLEPASGERLDPARDKDTVAYWHQVEIGIKGDRSVNKTQWDEFAAGLGKFPKDHGITGWERLPLKKDEWPAIRVPGFQTKDDETESLKVLEETFENFKERGARMLFVLLTSKDSHLYGAVKATGDVTVGIHTTCAAVPIQYGARVMGNIVLKMNLKAGGTNSGVQKLPSLVTEGTMFVGLDVTHPPAGAMEGAPGIAAAVATCDSMRGQWPASLRQQAHLDEGKKAQEIILDIETMMEDRIQCWFDCNDKLPDQIIIYRDGLSEAQFFKCVEDELKGIKRALVSSYGKIDDIPPVLLICAVKRHHQRFYPTRLNDADGKGNPKAGICVDGVVTYDPGSGFKDWFFRSHTALQGTAKPAHYVVLHQDKRIHCSLDDIQLMTHHMSYTFGRCTKPVRVHPAVYYADLAAERARSYLRRVYNPWPVEKADPPSAKGSKNQKGKGSAQATLTAGQKPEKPKFVEEKWRLKTEIHEHLKNSMFYI